MNPWTRALRAVLVAALAAGCSPPRAGAPPVIRYGESACDECRMLINEERHAAALATGSGDVGLFDSVDCLAKHLARESNAFERVWVHDYDSGAWMSAREAVYVHSPRLRTPMGLGIVAVSEQHRAEELAREVDGRVLPFEQLWQLGSQQQ